MDETPTASRCIPELDDTAISARLAAIEERLDEIIRRVDEMHGAFLAINMCAELGPHYRASPIIEGA